MLSVMPEPILKVSHLLTKAFHASGSIPMSMDGRLSLGALFRGTLTGCWCSELCKFNSAHTIMSLDPSGVSYVQPLTGHLITTIVEIRGT